MPDHGDECPGCGMELDIHQPDHGLPERLLGTCPACRSWHIIEGGIIIASFGGRTRSHGSAPGRGADISGWRPSDR